MRACVCVCVCVYCKDGIVCVHAYVHERVRECVHVVRTVLLVEILSWRRW